MKTYPTITNIMTKNPVTILDTSPLSVVIQTMKENNFNHLPVIDKLNNLIGIISKSDLYKRALSLSQETSGASYSNKILSGTKASEVMTKNPIVVSPDQSLEYAFELLLQGDFHAIPVVEGRRVVGVITSKDMLEFVADSGYEAI